MINSFELQQDALEFANKAVENDKKGQHNEAIFFYIEAIQAMLSAFQLEKDHSILERTKSYMDRVEILKSRFNNDTDSFSRTIISQEEAQKRTLKATSYYTFEEAMECDELNQDSKAIELYTQAAEIFISLKKESTVKEDKDNYAKFASKAIDRATFLKEKSNPSSVMPLQNSSTDNTFDIFYKDPDKQLKCTASNYTKEELEVLRATSKINGHIYVPFFEADLKQEKFSFSAINFTDKDGLLALSSQQKSKLKCWARPAEFCVDPKMILLISSYSIKQTLVTDCSFVASIAIAAQYERRFRKRIITKILYPQNRAGDPIYNPCGKYMVKLHLNGVLRKVIVDDLLPVGYDGELLCSFSTNRNELWVSILEKAYMKVMGGYDFPGSNSNTDLHSLTGWIPDRIGIKEDDLAFNKNKEFKKLFQKFHSGACLVTLATGDLEPAEAERAGLVPTHAYAMLDIREIGTTRLFLLKNPWSHLRWKGKFSDKDTSSWTPQLLKELNYDLNTARLVDNGVFWIDYDSLCHFFDVFYVNWNPELFTHTTCIHNSWSLMDGPKKDVYNYSNNPQYTLRARHGTAVWLLLTRHILDKDDFENNNIFMALVVYRGVKTKRVYYPHDPSPMINGVRINSPHNLVKIVLDDIYSDTVVNGFQNLHVIVTQLEKQKTVHYTLRAYSSAQITLNPIADLYKYKKEACGQWKGFNAGGCANNQDTYKNNPTYQVQLQNSRNENCIVIELKGPKHLNVGFDLRAVVENNSNNSNTTHRPDAYRQAFCVLELDNLSGGIYNLNVGTYSPNQEGPYILTVKSIYEFSIRPLSNCLSK